MKTGIMFRSGHPIWGGRKQQGLISYRLPLLSVGGGDGTDADQKIPDWLRLYFWERLKQQLEQVLNLCLVLRALAQVKPFWACHFFLTDNTIIYGPSKLNPSYYKNLIPSYLNFLGGDNENKRLRNTDIKQLAQDHQQLVSGWLLPQVP